MIDKKYRYILVSSLFSSLGSSMYFIAVAWIMYELTSDATYTGILVGLGFVPGVFLNMYFGVLVDRLNRKSLTVLSLSIVTISMVLLLFAMMFHFVLPWILIAVHMSVQTFSSLFRTAQQAFITEIYPKKEIPRVYSGAGSSVSVGGLIGTSLGGVVLSIASSEVVMLIVSLSFVLSLLYSLAIEPNQTVQMPSKQREEGTRKSIWFDLIHTFHYMNDNRILYAMLSIMFIGQLVVHTSAAMLSVYTSAYLEGTSKLYGILESAASIGAIVAGLSATWYLYKSKTYVASASLVITGIGLTILSCTKDSLMAFLAIFLIGAGTTWLRVLMQSIQQVATESAFYGRMAACRQMVNQGAVGIGSPVLGFIAESYGVQFSYAALLIPVLVSLFFTVYFAKTNQFRGLVHSLVSD